MGIEDQKPVASPSDLKKELKVCNVHVAIDLNGTATTMSAQPAVETQRARSCGSFQKDGLGTEDKISRVAPSGRLTVERTDVGDVNKGNEENEILQLHESKGEQSDLVLQSLRSENAHDAGPDDCSLPGSPADIREGGTNVSSAEVPEAIAVRISSTEDTEDVSSVVRDTTMRSGFAPKEGAATKASDSYYSSGLGHIINGPGVSA